MLKNFGTDVVGLVKNYKTLNAITGEQITKVNDYIDTLNTLKDTNALTTDSITGLYDSVESLNSDSLTYYFQSVAEGAENARVNIVDAYDAILDGNTHGLKNVQSIFNTYNNNLKGNEENQKAFTKAVGQSNSSLAKYLTTVGTNGTATLKGYAGQLVKTTAQTVLLTAKTIALQAAISIGLSLAINGLITLITEVVNRQKELVEQAKESAEKVDEQAKSLDELKEKYKEICDSADDEKTKNEKLNEIKQELIDVYGFEKDALKELNDERERGLDLLDGEFEKKNRNARNNWLEDNKDSIKKANEEMASDGVDYVTTYLSKNNIASSILELFDKQEAFGDTGYVNLEFDYTDTADRLNKLKNIYNEILDIQSKRSLTADEQQLLSDVKTKLDVVQGVYDKYYDIYSKAAKYNVENIVENYLNTDEGKIENVGKDTFNSWSKGLLDQAENAEQKRQLEDYIEEAFPDLTKYFENLAKARQKFAQPLSANQYEVAWAKEKDAFLESLSPEDLEASLNIPDLFADGLDGATAKIEAWKADPKNKITADVEVDDADLSTMLETASKKVKLITTAMEEMNDTGYISSSTYAEIVEMGGNFADCLEIQNGKLRLNVQKLKELEKQENLNAIAAKNLAISELQAAAAMAAQSHDADKVEEIRKQITALEKEKAVLWQINDEIANAKPNESGSGGSSSSDDPWKEQFDKEYSEKQHLLAMEKLSEEDYLDWLDGAYKQYFSDLTKYQDEYYKYEEEVYKGRKQLADDYFDEQQKLFEDRVSNLETQIEITTKISESSDGTKLNTKEKYDDIRSGYQEIINIIEERINEIVQAGVEGHEDLLAELEKQIEEYQEKLSDVFKSAVEEEKDYIEKQKDAFSDAYDERIDKIKEEKEAAEEAAQAEIDALEEKINVLKKANEKAEEANNIEKARQELEKAKNQRTIATVSASGAISYQADKEKVQEAQEELDKLLQEQQINILEDQKDALESAKNKQSEAFDTIISDLESEKEAGERRFDVLLKVLDDYLNPDPSTSNIDVWSTIAKQEGVKLDKKGQWVDADGNVIDIEALMKSAETKTDAEKNAGNNSKDNKDDSKDKTNGKGVEIGRIEKQSFGSENTEDKTDSVIDSFFAKLEKMYNLEQGSLTLEKVMSILIPSMNFNPYGAMNERINKAYSNGYVNNVNNNNSNSNVTFSGDININNPVANSYDLAEDIIKNLPNAVAKQIHKKNQ